MKLCNVEVYVDERTSVALLGRVKKSGNVVVDKDQFRRLLEYAHMTVQGQKAMADLVYNRNRHTE